jgi:hypothetical protein
MRALPALGLLVALAALVSCVRITGVDDLVIVKGAAGAAGASGAAGAGGDAPQCVSDAQTTCGQCIQTRCCPDALHCSEDAACKACLAAPAGCAGNPLLVAYESCAAMNCSTECPP